MLLILIIFYQSILPFFGYLLASFVDDLLEKVGEFLNNCNRLPTSQADSIHGCCGVVSGPGVNISLQ